MSKNNPASSSSPSPSPSSNSDPEKVVGSFYRDLFRLTTELAGKGTLSAGLQIPITYAISVGAAKVGGTPYPVGTKNFLGMSAGWVADLSAKIFKRRMIGSVGPSVVSSGIGNYFGLSPAVLTGVNTAFESSMAAFFFRESEERFRSARTLKIFAADGTSIDIMKATREQFLASGHSEEQWKRLVQKKLNYEANLPHQAIALAARNTIFSSAIFMAKPWAQQLIKEHGDRITQETGISKETAETTLTYFIRAALAWQTTIFDRALTLFSNGYKSSDEVYKLMADNFKQGNVKALFTGAVARTVLCLMTATTIAEGKVLGEWMEKELGNLFGFDVGKDSEASSPQRPSEKKSQNEISQESVKKAHEDFAKFIKEHGTPSFVDVVPTAHHFGFEEFGHIKIDELRKAMENSRKFSDQVNKMVEDIVIREQQPASSEKNSANNTNLAANPTPSVSSTTVTSVSNTTREARPTQGY